jgi:chromosome segregation ATPase
MKSVQASLMLLVLAATGASGAGAAVSSMVAVERAGLDPLGEVVKLLEGLVEKVKADGTAEAKAYKEYFAWCDSAAMDTGFAIKTATSKKESLEALIIKMSSVADAADMKVAELAASIAADGAELKNLTAIREREAKDFSASEKELKDVVDTLGRAIAIVEKEMSKNPAALAQVDTSSLDNLLKSLGTVVEAASLLAADRKTLAALVQQRSASADDDSEDDTGAPAAAVYKSSSSGVVDVLEDLKEKAEEQLSTLQKTESSALHNYQMAKQALEDQMGADTKTMEAQKVAKAEAAETKATSEGDLEVTLKDLADSKEVLKTCRANCMSTASDHESTVVARKEELTTLFKAISVIKSTTAGAVAETYSFVQTSGTNRRVGSLLRTHADLAKTEVVTLIKRLAKEQHSKTLSQLASRIAAVLQYGESAGEDPFAKVKTLVNGLISKLEAEAGSDASEKEYCDEQMTKTASKKGELEYDVSKLQTKIDQTTASIATLEAEVKELQGELAALAKSQAEMDKIRAESHSAYVSAKEDLEEGLTGVRNAISVLRDYYSGASSAAMIQDDAAATDAQPAKPEVHTKAAGAGGSIIGLLEVVESDFAKNLAEEETEEADSEAEYEKTTQDNSVTKMLKDQDVKYKSAELKSDKKALSELTADLETKDAELAAIITYKEKIVERCVAKPETYAERASRREAEIAGLKQALEVLESETAFVQRQKRGHRYLRAAPLQ